MNHNHRLDFPDRIQFPEPVFTSNTNLPDLHYLWENWFGLNDEHGQKKTEERERERKTDQ